MGEKTGISWTDSTFNSWWGCTKVSSGCTHCYAERVSARTREAVWGPNMPRRFFDDAHWAAPERWERAAAKSGVRRKVFAGSMMDVFEDHPDVEPHRERLFRLIEQTPHLDWQLLTKRIENVHQMAPWKQIWPPNLWLGVTAENQEAAVHRIPVLLTIPAAVRWISAEPLLGPLDLRSFLSGFQRVHWVVVGGESGSGARAMDGNWVLPIRQHCLQYEVPFFFKQLGTAWAQQLGVRDHYDAYPSHLRIRQFPRGTA